MLLRIVPLLGSSFSFHLGNVSVDQRLLTSQLHRHVHIQHITDTFLTNPFLTNMFLTNPFLTNPVLTNCFECREILSQSYARMFGTKRGGEEARWTHFSFPFCLPYKNNLTLILSYSGTVRCRNRTYTKEKN